MCGTNAPLTSKDQKLLSGVGFSDSGGIGETQKPAYFAVFDGKNVDHGQIHSFASGRNSCSVATDHQKDTWVLFEDQYLEVVRWHEKAVRK